MPYKVFVAGEEALAADVNSYLMSQTIPRFTNATQRSSQLTAPVLHQLSMRDDRPGVIQRWDGSAWVDLLPEGFVSSTPNITAAPNASSFRDYPITLPKAGNLVVDGACQAALVSGSGVQDVNLGFGATTPAPAAEYSPSVQLHATNVPQKLHVPIKGYWNSVSPGVFTIRLTMAAGAGAATAQLQLVGLNWRVVG